MGIILKGQSSIQKSGPNLSLVGDVEDPTPDQYYGTDLLGERGWHDVKTIGDVLHGSIGGLDADDHLQYLLLAGRGGQTITDNVTVNGNTVVTNSTAATLLRVASAGNAVASGNARIELTNGDANTFALQWTGSGNNFLRFQYNGGTKISFGTDGSMAMGFVGVPQAQLHQLLLAPAQIAHRIELAAAQTANAIEVNSTFATGGNLFNVTATGNVGIGTTNPQAKFHIDGTGGVSMQMTSTSTTLKRAIYLAEDMQPGLFVGLEYVPSAHNGSGLPIGIPNSGLLRTGNTATGGLILVTQAPTAPIVFATGGFQIVNERMRITPTGEVGIGTTTPAVKLHINRGASSSCAIFDSSSAGSTSTFEFARGGVLKYGFYNFQVDNSLRIWNYVYNDDVVEISANSDFNIKGALKTTRAMGGIALGNYAGNNVPPIYSIIMPGPGAIGMGTPTPSANLHQVVTTNTVGHRIDLAAAATADALQINSSGGSGGNLFKVAATGKISIVATTNSDDAVRITQTNVGGYGVTIVPGTDGLDALTINNAASTANRIRMFGSGRIAILASVADDVIQIRQTSAAGYGLTIIPGSDTNEALQINNAASSTIRHRFFGSGDVFLSSGAGKVGIGITAVAHLHQLVPSAATIGHEIDLFAAATADAIQVRNSALATIFKVDATGAIQTSTYTAGSKSGVNITGDDVTFTSGIGTGNLSSGKFIWKIGDATTSGSTSHTTNVAMTLDSYSGGSQYTTLSLDNYMGIGTYISFKKAGVQRWLMGVEHAGGQSDFYLAGNAGATPFYITGAAPTNSFLIDNSGNSGFGTGATVSARVHALSTTEQLRIGYNTTNYFAMTVDSGGLGLITTPLYHSITLRDGGGNGGVRFALEAQGTTTTGNAELVCQVATATSGNPKLSLRSNVGGGYQWTLYGDTADAGKFKIRLVTGNTTMFTLTASGFFGLGYSPDNPLAALHQFMPADVVAHRMDLLSGHTSDAIQVNSFGVTGGNLFRVSSSGSITISGTYTGTGISGIDGSGLNATGGNLSFNAGRSTGSAVGGDHIFYTTPAGTSGSGLNTLVERFRITADASKANAIINLVPSQVTAAFEVRDSANLMKFRVTVGGNIESGTVTAIGTINASTVITAGQHLFAGASYAIGWPTRTVMYAPVIGDLTFQDHGTGTGFNKLMWGGTTAAYPAIKRNLTALEVKLADDSALTQLRASNFVAGTGVGNFSPAPGLEVNGAPTTIYGAGFQPTQATVAVYNESSIVDTFSQVLLINRGSAAAYTRLVNIHKGPNLSEFEINVGGVGKVRITQAGNVLLGSISGQEVTGLNQAGNSLIVAGGAATGNAAGGSILFQTSDVLTSGSTVQSLTTKMTLTSLGRLGVNISVPVGVRLDVREDSVDPIGWGSSGVQYGILTYAASRAIVRAIGSGYYLNLQSNNGNIMLSDNVGTAFGLLQFGGTTSSFPALKRNGTSLQIKLADDSALAGLECGTFKMGTSTTAGYVLTADASGNGTWMLPTGGGGGTGTPGLPANSIQFNDAGAFGGDADLTYDKANNMLYADQVGIKAGGGAIYFLGSTGTVNEFPFINNVSNTFTIRGGSIVGGNGRAINITGGYGVGTNSNGGGVNINGGSKTGTGVKGDVNLQSSGGLVSIGAVISPVAHVNQTVPASTVGYRMDLNGTPSDAIQIFNSVAASIFKVDGTGAVQATTFESIGATTDNNFVASVSGVTAKACMRTVSAGGSHGQFFLGANESSEAVRFDGTKAAIGVTHDCRDTIGQVNYHYFTAGGLGSYPITIQLYAASAANTAGVTLSNNGIFGWSNLTVAYSGRDTGISRSTAGLVEFNNGTVGTLRDLVARQGYFGTVSSSDVSGTNSPGNALIVAGGKATGTAAGGSIQFQTSDVTTSGTTVQTLTTKMTLSSLGTLSVTASIVAVGTVSGNHLMATNSIYWSGKSDMQSPSDGIIRFTDSSGSTFNRLQFGGGTSAFPALKRSSTTLQCRLADDSNYSALEALSFTAGTMTISANLISVPAASEIAFQYNALDVCKIDTNANLRIGSSRSLTFLGAGSTLPRIANTSDTLSLIGGNNAAGAGSAVSLMGGSATGTDLSGGAILINGGAKNGLGADGNVVIANSRGKVGVGSAAPASMLHVLSTTEQLRVGYDTSNYYSATVSSAGAVTFNAVGASAGFTFSDAVTVPSLTVGTTTLNFNTQFGIHIGDGSTTITTGFKGFIRIPYGMTITGWELVSYDSSGAAVSGSIVLTLWKDSYANFPPTAGGAITGSAKPTLSSVTKNTSTTLTGWTITIASGDWIGYSVDSVTTCKKITLIVYGVKT